MHTATQPMLTREQARQLLNDLKAAYQSLDTRERDAVRHEFEKASTFTCGALNAPACILADSILSQPANLAF